MNFIGAFMLVLIIGIGSVAVITWFIKGLVKAIKRFMTIEVEEEDE